jgi:hypothetical protein
MLIQIVALKAFILDLPMRIYEGKQLKPDLIMFFIQQLKVNRKYCKIYVGMFKKKSGCEN